MIDCKKLFKFCFDNNIKGKLIFCREDYRNYHFSNHDFYYYMYSNFGTHHIDTIPNGSFIYELYNNYNLIYKSGLLNQYKFEKLIKLKSFI